MKLTARSIGEFDKDFQGLKQARYSGDLALARRTLITVTQIHSEFLGPQINHANWQFLIHGTLSGTLVCVLINLIHPRLSAQTPCHPNSAERGK